MDESIKANNRFRGDTFLPKNNRLKIKFEQAKRCHLKSYGPSLEHRFHFPNQIRRFLINTR